MSLLPLSSPHVPHTSSLLRNNSSSHSPTAQLCMHPQSDALKPWRGAVVQPQPLSPLAQDAAIPLVLLLCARQHTLQQPPPVSHTVPHSVLHFLSLTSTPLPPAMMHTSTMSRNKPWSTTPSSARMALLAAWLSLMGVCGCGWVGQGEQGKRGSRRADNVEQAGTPGCRAGLLCTLPPLLVLLPCHCCHLLLPAAVAPLLPQVLSVSQPVWHSLPPPHAPGSTGQQCSCCCLSRMACPPPCAAWLHSQQPL